MAQYDSRFLSKTGRIETEDIDWNQAGAHGLTDDVAFALRYFADIESQTIRYLRSLLQMSIALRPDVAAFLTTWSYEEFFHGEALSRLLDACGHTSEPDRVMKLAEEAKLNEWIEDTFAPLVSRLFPHQLTAVYTSFGAIQEMTTLRGYESLAGLTRNPALELLCTRIAKQERRHFAWYFNMARTHLEGSRTAQLLTRATLRWNWVPVGAGVKPREETARLFSILFPAERGTQVATEIDEKMGTLPGLQDIRLMRAYFAVA